MPTRVYPCIAGGGGGGGGSWPAKPVPDDTNYWIRSTGSGVADGAAWDRIRQSNVLANFGVTVTKTTPGGSTAVYARGQPVNRPGGGVSYSGTPPAVVSASPSIVMVGGAQAGDVNTVVFNAMTAPFTSFSASSGDLTRTGTDLGADPTAQLRVDANNGGAGSGTTTITFTGTIYIGTGAAGQSSEAFIQGLATVVVSTTRVRNVALSFTGTQKVYYAEPKRMSGVPTFKDQATQFDVPMTKVAEVLVDNGFGFDETQDLYESDNLYNVNFTLQVT